MIVINCDMFSMKKHKTMLSSLVSRHKS